MAQKFTGQGHGEQDSRWAAVDAYAASHLFPPSQNKYHEALEYAYNNSLEKGLPDMASYPAQGKLLALQAQISGAKNVLEVGTLGGYAAIWIATGIPADGKITTVEVDPKHKEIAEENIAHAGFSEKITVELGAGLDVLPRLADEVKSGKREPFDFVFIDADKKNNLAYFNTILPALKSRTPIFVDNVVRRGRLADETLVKEDPSVAGSRQIVEAVGRNDKVEAVVIQTVSEKSYDGFLLAVVK